MEHDRHYEENLVTISIDFNTVVDEDGFILSHIRHRIEDLSGQSSNTHDFASHLAARCGLTGDDLTKFMRGQLSVSPERARRIETALNAAEDRDRGSDLGGFNGGGDGGITALIADLDEMTAEYEAEDAAAAGEPELVEDHRDEVEHQVEVEAAAAEPAPVEPELIEPADPILEDAVERDQVPRNRALLALIDAGSLKPARSRHPLILADSAAIEGGDALDAIEVAERIAMFAELESRAARRKRPAPKSAPGTLDKARRERAEKATAKVAARISVKNPHRGILQALRRERARRLTALRNACKVNAADPVFRKLAGREEEICDGWLAVAWARQRFGPDASFSQVAMTMHELRVRTGDAEHDDPKPTRRQARTAVERTLKLESEGMPWQRYRTL